MRAFTVLAGCVLWGAAACAEQADRVGAFRGSGPSPDAFNKAEPVFGPSYGADYKPFQVVGRFGDIIEHITDPQGGTFEWKAWRFEPEYYVNGDRAADGALIVYVRHFPENMPGMSGTLPPVIRPGERVRISIVEAVVPKGTYFLESTSNPILTLAQTAPPDELDTRGAEAPLMAAEFAHAFRAENRDVALFILPEIDVHHDCAALREGLDDLASSADLELRAWVLCVRFRLGDAESLQQLIRESAGTPELLPTRDQHHTAVSRSIIRAMLAAGGGDIDEGVVKDLSAILMNDSVSNFFRRDLMSSLATIRAKPLRPLFGQFLYHSSDAIAHEAARGLYRNTPRLYELRIGEEKFAPVDADNFTERRPEILEAWEAWEREAK
jgi:hypothetical protein